MMQLTVGHQSRLIIASAPSAQAAMGVSQLAAAIGCYMMSSIFLIFLKFTDLFVLLLLLFLYFRSCYMR